MKTNEGFTIVELLVALSLLLIISIFVINRIVNSDENTKNRLYETKVSLIKSAAYKYGSDHIDELGSTCTYVTVSSLINNKYLIGDSDNKQDMINPKDNGSMNNMNVCIKYENKKIVTSME